MFTDEATFKINGALNIHNCHYDTELTLTLITNTIGVLWYGVESLTVT